MALLLPGPQPWHHVLLQQPSPRCYSSSSGGGGGGGRAVCCSSASINIPSASSESNITMQQQQEIRWGWSKVQGPRSEMEDEVLIVPAAAAAAASPSSQQQQQQLLHGFSFAAVLDGHAGFSSVQFLRDVVYQECASALQGGVLLTNNNLQAITDSIRRAFIHLDSELCNWLESMDKEDDSGATATVIFLSNDLLVVSHLGDSRVVISCNGTAQVLTNFHRPYGNNRVSVEEVKRIRAAGGWIVDGRICGDISVSRAFGDIRFKRRKNEMLVKGVEEGRWTEKFVSRINFKEDLVICLPDISLMELGSDVEFILLASDGLWDYIKSSDAVEFVRNQLRQHGDVQLASDALAQAALDRRSQDNVSIVIADLGRTNWQELTAPGPNFFYELSQAFATVGIVSIGIWISSFLAV